MVEKVTAEKKKRSYFESKLTENTGKPKELWKTLKVLGLSFYSNSRKDDEVVKYDLKSISEVCQTFFVEIELKQIRY